MNNLKQFFLGCLIFLINGIAWSNNIQISNARLVGSKNGRANSFTMIQFNLSWENSWRISTGPANWDAAWVFVKFRVGASGAWTHARLNNTGHIAATGSTIDPGLQVPGSAFNNATNPCVGVFIYRSSNGSGTNTFNNIQLRWNYGANSVANNANVGIQVFAIEMVYVPGGFNHNVGGGGGSKAFTSTTINTANATIAGGYPPPNAAVANTLPNTPNWPNGYTAFYCMKYEISQGQYRDFLNTLTYTQQAARTNNLTPPNSVAGTGVLNSTNLNRNGIDIQTPGTSSTVPAVYACNLNSNTVYNEATDGEWIACNFLTWMDGCAYLFWSGLRPLSEMEYEKACRGNQPAVSGEYAWGNTTITAANGISNSGANNETSNNAVANAVYSNLTGGPLRVGAFAKAATNRQEAGATYYGIMDMSGNLQESAVNLGTTNGKNFTRLEHGTGTLSAGGEAQASSWPNSSTFSGGGWRLGSWFTDASALGDLQVSDRSDMAGSTSRLSYIGFRGARQSP